MHFVKFHPEVASCLLSGGKRKYAPGQQKVREHGSGALRKWQTKMWKWCKLGKRKKKKHKKHKKGQKGNEEKWKEKEEEKEKERRRGLSNYEATES